MLMIRLGVMSLVTTWHIGEPFPSIEVTADSIVTVDGDELLYVQDLIRAQGGAHPPGNVLEEDGTRAAYLINMIRKDIAKRRKANSRTHTVVPGWAIWSDEKPAVEGWYWMRYRSDGPLQIVQLVPCDDTFVLFPGLAEPLWGAVEFAGPIPEPAP